MATSKGYSAAFLSYTDGMRVSIDKPAAAVFLLALVYCLLLNADGLFIRHDQRAQLYAARSFIAGQGMVNPPLIEGLARTGLEATPGSPVTQWPPGHILLLSALTLLSPAHTVELLTVVTAFIGAGIAVCVFRLTRPALGNMSAALVALVTLLSPPMIEVQTSAISEPLFILWCLLFYVVEWYPARIAAAGLACLWRYTGVALVIAGVWSIQGWKPRIGFMVLSLAPLALWLARNRLVSDTPFGERPPPMFDAAEVVGFTQLTLETWIPFVAGLVLIVGIIQWLKRR